jgi:hypothetical protein
MITALPHRSFPVMRFGPVTTSAYDVEKPAHTNTFCDGTLSTASPNDIARLEEGKRTRQAFKLITASILNVAAQGGQLPDWVFYNQGWYEVSALLPWQNTVISHYEYIITKIENPSEFI